MSRDDPQMKLRLPDGMRERLKAAAELNKRSMNAEIVARLETSLQVSPSGPISQEVADDISKTLQKIVDLAEEAGRSGGRLTLTIGRTSDTVERN